MGDLGITLTKVAVIDLDSVAYSIGNGVKLKDTQGNPIREDGKRFVYRDKTEEELILTTDHVMNSILTKGGFTHYIGFMKGQNTTDRRKGINPEYKANRNEDPPKWWDFVLEQLAMRWQCNYVHGMEVDDAVNITRGILENYHIVAIDKDLLGLEGTHYNWRTGEWVTVSKKQATFNFWRDMICGQVGDNIKGIPGKGPRAFDKLFPDTIFPETNVENLPGAVLAEYIKYFGEYLGMSEFQKNYMSLKILQYDPMFRVPQPVEFKQIQVAELDSSLFS